MQQYYIVQQSVYQSIRHLFDWRFLCHLWYIFITTFLIFRHPSVHFLLFSSVQIKGLSNILTYTFVILGLWLFSVIIVLHTFMFSHFYLKSFGQTNLPIHFNLMVFHGPLIMSTGMETCVLDDFISFYLQNSSLVKVSSQTIGERDDMCFDSMGQLDRQAFSQSLPIVSSREKSHSPWTMVPIVSLSLIARHQVWSSRVVPLSQI